MTDSRERLAYLVERIKDPGPLSNYHARELYLIATEALDEAERLQKCSDGYEDWAKLYRERGHRLAAVVRAVGGMTYPPGHPLQLALANLQEGDHMADPIHSRAFDRAERLSAVVRAIRALEQDDYDYDQADARPRLSGGTRNRDAVISLSLGVKWEAVNAALAALQEGDL